MLSLISGLLVVYGRRGGVWGCLVPTSKPVASIDVPRNRSPSGQASGGERSLLPDDSLDVASVLQTLANLGARVARASTLLCWHAEQFCHVLLHFCTIAPLQKQRSRLAARWLP